MRQIKINDGLALKCLDCGVEYAVSTHHVCIDVSSLSEQERLGIKKLNYEVELQAILFNLSHESDGFDILETDEQIKEYVNLSNASLRKKYGDIHLKEIEAPLHRSLHC